MSLPIEALVTSSPGAQAPTASGPHRAVVELCRSPRSVAEVAALIGIPLGVARIVVDDLFAAGSVAVRPGRHGPDGPDLALLHRVREGLLRL